MTGKNKCTVLMDDKETTSYDFVAILSKDNGDAGIFYDTDALTLGMAVKMITRAFVEALHECTEEECVEINAVLGDAFVAAVED